MHRLLKRQIKKYIKDNALIDKLQLFIHAVDSAYKQADEDRILLERSIKLAGQELLDRNKDLELQLRKVIKAEEELTNSVDMLQSTLETLTEGVLIIDLNGKPSFFNEKLLVLWQLDTDKISNFQSEEIYELFQSRLLVPDYFKMQQIRIDYIHEKFCMIHELSDGQVYEFEGVYNQNVGHIWCFRDITEKFRHEEKLIQLAHHDHLTGLPNRLLLIDRTYKAIQRAERINNKVALMFFDLDRFKQINDTMGHEVGDKILIKVAQRISKIIRKQDTLTRLGGDEFVVLLEIENNISLLHRISDEIINAFQKPFIVEGQKLFISTSIGGAFYPDHGNNASMLLKKSDIAMYQAKSHGRNCFKMFASEMEQMTTKAFSVENKIRRAIEKKEFLVYFQPIISVKNCVLSGYEILLRWPTSQGFISPDTFIPIAEHSGLIVPLGELVIEEVFKYITTLNEQDHSHLTFSINFSPKQFQSANIFEYFTSQIKHYNINPKNLAIEVTESNVLEDFDECIKIMNNFKALGVKIYLDDFGTGHSSLSYLKMLPLDAIKIDKSFIKDLTRCKQDLEIIKAIISLGHTLNLNIIAEGIELSEQFRVLFEIECDMAQGFLLGKPSEMLPYKPLKIINQ